MILKDQTPPDMATNSFHLSVMDQNNVRVYTQTLNIFPFPDGIEAENAIRALEVGLDITLQKFPWLAGTLSLTDPKSGILSLTYPTDPPSVQADGLFKSKQIPYHEQDFPYTYEQLKRDGMPPSAFKGEMFRPDDFANYPGIPANGEGLVDFTKSDAPVMRVQVFFIPGGLILSVYVHHSVMDCSGINEFWKHYAAAVSKAAAKPKGGMRDEAPPTIPDQSTLRLQLDAQVQPVPPHQRNNAEAYCDGVHQYRQTLPPDTECSQKLFVIPAERIRSFRDELRPSFPEDSPPTICNVLAALVWIHVTRARAARLRVNGYIETNIGIAVDLRKRQNPPLTVNYMGDMAIFAKGASKIEDFVSEKHVTTKSIIRTIEEIKRTIAKVDDCWIKKHLAFFKSIARIENTECALGFRFGADIYITSWMNFGADHKWGIPGTDLAADSLGGRPEFIRRTYGPSDGGMMILPRRRALVKGVEAPYEVMIRLATEDMERLEAEEGGLASWAHVID